VQAVADSDAALVERCRSDDHRAFDQIVVLYKDRVLNYVRGMISDRDDADDIAQQTFVKAYVGLRSFQNRASLHTWILRIATNLCIDYRRRRGRPDRRPVYLGATGDDAQAAALEIVDTRCDPAQAYARQEMSLLTRNAIEALPDRLRTVLILHDMEGLPYEEIARIVRCPLGTVKSRLFHARMNVREQLLPYLRGDVLAQDGESR